MISLTSILKASQTLSSELALETLLVKIMRIVIENAAAQTGYLILHSQHNEKWMIEASGTIASDEVQILQSIPIQTVTSSSETPLLSTAIANYVIRTQKSVVLHDAVREGEFVRDPYIIQQQPKSLLCMPLSVQDKLVGILYLENNLTTGVFTPDRLDVLNLLSSQAAISIENAKLYAQLRESERKSIQINAFQDITERKQTEKLLTDYNCTLEAEVTQRTAKLTQINQQLEREIAERKRTQDALQQSEARYRAIVEDQTELVSRLLPDGTLLFVNEAYCRYFGVKREELIGKHYAPVVFADDLEHIEQLVKSINKDNPVVIIENRVVVAGKVRWTQWINRALFDPQGNVVELQSVGRDINDLKHVEQALRESERRYRQIVETANEGIWVIDSQGNTTFANPKMAQMLGYSVEEMLGMPIFAFVDEQDYAIAQQNLDSRRQGISGTHDFKLRHRDGSDLWVVVASNPIFDESGQYAGALKMMTDITQRKRTEEALEQSERLFRLLAEISPVGIFRADALGQTIYANERACQIVGVPLDEVLGWQWSSYIHPEDAHRVQRGWEYAITHQVPWQDEYRLLNRENKEIWVLAQAETERDETGQLVGYVGTLTDISDRKRAELALHESEERWQLALRGTHDAIWDWNVQTNTVFFSPRWKEMRGFAEHEMSNSLEEWSTRIHPDDRDRVMQALTDHFAQKTPFFSAEYRVRRKDNTYIWILDRGQAIWDEAGNAVRMAGSETDITQRKQAQEALTQSESRFRAVFEQAAVGMGLCTVEGHFFRVNQKLCDIIGYTHAEMLERTFQDITPVKDRPQLRQSVCQLLAGEIENYSLENRYICKDGSVVWVNVAVSLMREPTGEPQYFIYIAEDISDRKRAEQALKKSEHALAEAQRLAHLGNWSFDLLAREMTWSDEVFRIYGLDPDRGEPTEQQHLQQFHPDDREQLQRSVQLAITQGQPYEHEIRIFLPNGSMRYTLGRGQPVFDETGRVVQLFGTVQDITQRKQAEEELRESEAKFRQLAENIREVFFILDKSGQILYLSPAYEQVWGQTRESLYQNPRSWLESVHPEEQPQIAAALDRQIAYTVEFDEIYRIVRFDGEIRWIRARSFPVEHHNSYRFVGIAEDITVSKQAEETLKQAKLAAEAANQAKSAFLANMSHELRTPLNAILGFSQLMYKSSNLPLEHKKNLGIIIRSGEHLLALINQVLDLSKIEAGRTTLNETDFNLYRLLDDLQDLFQLKANHQGLHLDFERSPDVPQYIRTDEVKLRQVLINLLSNAMKFTSSGGVSLRVSREIGNRQENTNSQFPIPNSQLHFEVEDTGSGIAAEEIDCIFDAFVQTKTGQQFQEGTGLGLTISRKFVELMGGEISVSSQVGRGTTFTFDIRVQLIETPELECQQPTRRAIALEPNQPSYRILIVDDTVNNRQVLSELLSPFGLELQEASNGLEAIAIWEAWQPHLILMDMRMPVMDGYEATQRIKSLTKGQATTIIAVTASSLEEERATILSAGCDDFIRKPFKEQEICDALHKHIGVRFVYDEPAAIHTATETKPDTLIPSALATLPVDLVADFHQSLMELDVEQIQSFIERIRELNEPLANALATFTNNFQYEKLLNLIQSSRG